ncbi:MAG: hypothetical protein ACOH13_13345 [Flavobacteriales bacterium]
MAKKRLSEKEIDHLLSHYRSERRRLSFQLDHVRGLITDLKESKGKAPKSAPVAKVNADGTPKRGPGRPPKNPGATKTSRPVGRPRKRERKPRELNTWDNMVLEAIKSTGRLMPKEELLEQATVWASKNEPSLGTAEVEAFLTRTLQKLSGKKNLLGTHHSGLRRGYHYGLNDWFFQSSGKLRKQHFDRLVLTAEKEAELA